MSSEKTEALEVIYDVLDRSAIIVLGRQTATIPFPVYSQREANIMGRELARNLGWFHRQK